MRIPVSEGESPCDRPPWDQDSEGRCYFHSEAEKDPGEFRERFLGEIGRLRKKRSEEYNFSRFVLPDFNVDSGGIGFDRPLIFRKARFTGSFWLRKVTFASVNFDEAVFSGGVDFAWSSFQSASFERTEFKGLARFEGANFNGPVSFKFAKFDETNFANCRFNSDSNFIDATFKRAHFPGATFSGFVHFGGVTFGGRAYFRSATFVEGTFHGALFHGDANFGDSTFRDWLSFSGTRFLSWVNFEDAKFQGQVRFEPVDGIRTHFATLANFDRARFEGFTLFEEVEFYGPAVFTDAEVRAKLIFQDVITGPHGAVDFRYVSLREDFGVEYIGHKDSLYLDHVRLLHTDATKVRFQNVKWWRDGRGRIVFDEVVLNELRDNSKEADAAPDSLGWLSLDSEGQPSNRVQVAKGTTFGSLEGLYRGLRKNYEESLRYPEAGDFYIREMEMQRLGRADGPGLRNWRRRNLSLYSIYWLLSEYGESYGRALWWIAGSFLLFAFIRLMTLPATSLFEAFYLSGGAMFQVAVETPIDHIQRLWSILILALFFLAVRRRLKR